MSSRPSFFHLPLVVSLLAAAPAFAGQSPPFLGLPWAPHGTTPQARYGAVVAPAGDVNGDGFSDVLVTAPREEGPATDAGRVYLYLGSKVGLASTPAWSWSANQAGGATGTSAAAAGDVNGDGYGDVVVGTPLWNAAGPVASAGKISIFHGGPAGLPVNPNYERLAPTPTANARFGFAVGTAGNVNGDAYDDLIVGAPLFTSGGLAGRGAGYVFHGGAPGLAATPTLTILGAEAGANAGKAVSTAGDVDADGFADVLVGAPGATFSGLSTGTASLYRGSAGGVLAVADTVLGGEFDREEVGAAVANAGDVDGDGYADVLVGHPGYSNGAWNRGGYELLRGGPGGLVAPAAVVVHSQTDGERLGASVATFGDLNADGYADFGAGAPADSMQFPSPHVFVHLGRPVIGLGTDLLSSSGNAANFGFSIATAGDVDGDGFSEFLVGDPGASVVPAAAEGAAALFELPRSVPVPLPDGPVSAGESGTQRGAAVAISPGLSAVGFPSLISGEPLYDFGAPDVGLLLINPGNPDGFSFGIFTTKFGESAGDHFSAALADAGDIDRDGYSDVLVSSPTRTGAGGNESGRVSLMRGAQGGALDPVPVLEGDQALQRLGSAIAGRGDVDGDGYHDVLVGAPTWDGPGLPDCGKVWLLYGGPSGFRAGSWTAQGTIAGQGLGASVSIGDLDADGFSDVLVASVSPLALNPPAGKVAVYYGGPAGADVASAWEVSGFVPSSTFGAALVAAGDVTGDDVCDLVVGAPGDLGTGRVYVFEGGRGRGKPTSPRLISGTQAGALFGARIAGGGDLDGDGIGDLVVGEPAYDGGQTDEGRVHAFYGNPNGVIPAWSFEGNTASLGFGSAISSLIDLNRDGFADFAIGAPANPSAAGRVYVFTGGGGIARGPSLMLQRDFSANPFLYYPVHTGANQSVLASLAVRSAEGRGRVAVQLEAIPFAQKFGGTPTQNAGTFDTGAPNAVVGVVTQLDLPWMGIAYKVRARTRSRSPFFPGSRWVRAEAHSEGDFDVYRGGTEVAVTGPGAASLAPRLSGIAPNPVVRRGGAARIAFDLPRPAAVRLDVFDVRGTRVRRLLDELRPAGPSTATWDGTGDSGQVMPPGLYFVRLAAENVVAGARLVRLP